MLNKVLILFNCIFGYVIKSCIDLKVLKIPKLDKDNKNNVIVSLTSYGRRVSSNVVYYTLVSLLRQTIQPSRIILWLSKTEWNDTILPYKITQLKHKGVEIRYCADLRSYKKLVPAILEFPQNSIITVDDDVIYSSDTIEMLLKEHAKYPNDIICLNAMKPILVDGIPQMYKRWSHIKQDTSNLFIFPIGVGGILYPPGSLHPDVVINDKFQKLCPNADDIWFWFNSMRVRTIKRYIRKRGQDFSFDTLYQYFHNGSALTHTNRFEDQNDKSFINLFHFYHFKLSALDISLEKDDV